MNDFAQNIDATHVVAVTQNARLQLIRGSSYDLSNTCNLTCEGCLYFARSSSGPAHDGVDAEWETLFAAEAARGINFAYLAGAEPALQPARLQSAWRHIKTGVIFTNGTRKIDPTIGYRIHVSLWGIGETAKELRGADVNTKAFRNFGADPRAVFVFTINGQNTDEIVPVAALAAEHGAILTYSYHSPTDQYLDQTSAAHFTPSDYLTMLSAGTDIRHTPETFAKARTQIATAMELYPDTVKYSMHYNDWITQPSDVLWELDENGIAINCGNRNTPDHRHYGADTSRQPGKCCSPNLNCAECRPYAQGLGSYLSRREEFLGTREDRRGYVEGLRLWKSLFLPLEAAD